MPLVVSVSAREPASIHTPTVAVCAWGCASVATVRPFERVVTSVNGFGETAVASDRKSTWEFFRCRKIIIESERKANARVSVRSCAANERVLWKALLKPFNDCVSKGRRE